MQKMSDTATNEYIVVHRFDKITPLSPGNIPLHLTVLHWFETDAKPQLLLDAVSGVTKDFQPIQVRATAEALFGPNYDIPVMRLEKSQELTKLRLAILSLVRSIGAKFDERWVGDNWSPHVTHKPNRRFSGDEIATVDSLDLIMKSPRDERLLLGEFGMLY